MRSLVSVALLLVLFAACDTANNQHPSAQYEEKKVSLKEMETSSPLKFLKVKGDYRSNLVNQTVVEGDVVNNATLVSYRNVQLQIIFKDKEGNTVFKEKEVLDDIMKPGSNTAFKLKLSHVKDANTVSVDITAAEADL